MKAVTSVVLSAGLRIPLSIVWTTPGLALLATTGPVDRGFPVVLGAFVVVGLLVALTGAVPPVSRALRRLPVPLTAAVLAGGAAAFCLAPATAVADLPAQAGVIVLAWALAWRWAPAHAAAAALGALVLVVAVTASVDLPASGVVPRLELTAPAFDATAVTGLALPLPRHDGRAEPRRRGGAQRAGLPPPVGPVLVTTGAASALAAPLAVPTVNLAAITGALTAGAGRS